MITERINHRARLINALPYAALVILTAIVYYKAVGFEFLSTWDDGEYILNNENIRGVSLHNIKTVFTGTVLVSYDPIHMLSLMADYSLWGGYSAKGYHIGNIVLHGLNACILYSLVRSVTGSWAVGFISSALFAVHPVNVENVAWCSERKTLLSSMFFLLAFGRYVSFTETGSRRSYFLSLGLYTASILTKATTITFPIVLLLYDYFLRNEGLRLRRLVPFFLLAAGGSLLFINLFFQEGVVGGNSISLGILLGKIYPSMTTILWQYMRLVFWPFELSGLYDAILYTWLTIPVLVAVGGWIVLFTLVLRSGNRQVKFWFLWFWACLLPVSGIIPQNTFYYADRYMYTPAIGLMVILSFGIEYIWRHFGFPDTVRRKAVHALAVLVVANVAYTAHLRTEVWRNNVVFWQDTVAKSPDMFKPHLNLGVAYNREGMLREAEVEYLKALKLRPYSLRAQQNLKKLHEDMEYMERRERQQIEDLKKEGN